MLRPHALEASEQLRVETELQQAVHLRGERELRVHGLVGPGPGAARAWNAPQEIGPPKPPAAMERPLVDDIDAAVHRVESALRGIVGVIRDLLDGALRPEPDEVRGLVGEPAFAEELRSDVGVGRGARPTSFGHGRIERRRMRARREGRDVARGEPCKVVSSRSRFIGGRGRRRPRGASLPRRAERWVVTRTSASLRYAVHVRRPS